MMRLQRVGRRNDPSYRVVVTDKRTGPKSNKHVAILGSYNPKMDHVQLEADNVKSWLQKGVQPSPTVHNILVGQGIIDAPKVNVLPKKSPIVDEAAEAAKKAEAEAAAAAEAEPAEASEDAPEEPATEESGEAEAAPEAEVAEESETEEAKAAA